jgi:imidazolonepropionase-like amidohydrolase
MAIVHGLLIDGTGADPIPDGILLIEGNRITAAGPASEITIPAGARVIDARQGAILPGIINSHVHESSSPAIRRTKFLLSGVTSTCDLATSLDSMPLFAKDDPSGPSARGFKAGPIIGPPKGYPDMPMRRGLLYPVESPTEAREAVVDLISRGADVIKIAFEPGFAGYIWPVMGKEEACAVVEEAHAHGKLVRAHVTRSDMLGIALDCGVDVIEHIPVPLLSEADWDIALQDERIFRLPADYDAQLSRMVDQQTIMVPTLSITPGARNWYIVPQQYRPFVEQLFIEPVRRFHDLGGIVALGNDYGNPGAEAGIPLGEMQMLATAGLMPMEILRAATKHAAFVCGHGEELGTLEQGKLADVIVVNGNPLEDLSALENLRAIVKDGDLVYPEQ